MIEFVLKNRKFRLHPDGIIYTRSINKYGKESKSGCLWKEVKFFDNGKGYLKCTITIEGVQKQISKHRLVWFAYNPEWNIFDGNQDNCIDHINRDKTDNRIENLRNLTNQQNCFNTNAKGYWWCKRNSKYIAQIMVGGVSELLGSFDNEEDARNAYLKAKNTYHIIE